MKKRKKILQITTTYQASPGQIMKSLQGMGETEGYRMVGAFGRGTAPLDYESIKIGNRLDVYKHVARTRIFDQHGFGSKKSTLEFIEKIRELDPDIIHLHNIHGYYLNVEMLFDYIKEENKPVVWTLHDCWPFTGHCAYFDYAGCECWKPDGNHHCIQKESYPASWLLNNSKNNYARKKEAFTGVNNMTIITPSKWLAKLVKKSFLKDYPVKVINNGVDIEVFKPSPTDFKKDNNIDNQFMILGVASVWDERKGLKYFIELSEVLESDEVIVLVGLSEKKLKSLPEKIIGIPRTNSIQELAEIYSASDVFVNPTLEDNFPTTNLESLASGTPVITFATGGSPESLDKEVGFITNYKTADSISKAIHAMRKSPLEKETCREKGKLYSKERMFDEYIKLLNKIK